MLLYPSFVVSTIGNPTQNYLLIFKWTDDVRSQEKDEVRQKVTQAK